MRAEIVAAVLAGIVLAWILPPHRQPGYAELRAVLKDTALGTPLQDATSGTVLTVRRPWRGVPVWFVTHMEADGAHEAMRDLDAGDQFGIVPTRVFLVGLGHVRRKDDPTVVHQPDEATEPWVLTPRPQGPAMSGAFERRWSITRATDTEVRDLTERLRRAVPPSPA